MQQALAAAAAGGPDIVRIKQGTYYVDEGLTGGATRDSTFFVPAGTVIRGGYPLTPNPSDSDRNPLRFPVTLSADLDRNDVYLYPGFEAGNYTSLAFNAYHCLVVSDSATSTTEISGIIVEGGNADGGSPTDFSKGNGGGIYCGDGTPLIRNCVVHYCRAKMTQVPLTTLIGYDGLGGGLYARGFHDGGTLVVRDTQFQHCHALWGGGLYMQPTIDPAPTNGILLVGCRFILNRADRAPGARGRGGGAALDHGIGTIDVINCEFTRNLAESDPGDGSGVGAGLMIGLPTLDEDCALSCGAGCGGGGECTEGCVGPGLGMTCPDMSCEDCATNTVLTNCVFRANVGRGAEGGAVRLRRKAAFNHCVFVANETDIAVGAGVAIAHDAFAQFNSCIIWGNLAHGAQVGAGLETQIYVTLSNPTCFGLFNCDVEFLGDPASTACPISASTGNIEDDPEFVVDPHPGLDGEWGTGDTDETLGDLRLRPDSPCIDEGDDDLLPPDTGDIDVSSTTTEDLPLDLPYRPRSVDGECGGGNPVVDMGAYEYWCLGDLNNDCAISGMDLAILLGQWTTTYVFPCPPFVDMESDLDRDCKVDGFDLAILLGLTWGACPAAGQGEGASAPGGGEAASGGAPGETGCGDDQALFQQWLDSGEMDAFWQWYECVLGSGASGGPTQ